jgi:glycosidase
MLEDRVFGKNANFDYRVNEYVKSNGSKIIHNLEPIQQTGKLTVYSGGCLSIESLYCFLDNGSKDKNGYAKIAFRKIKLIWDNVSWCYVTQWEADIQEFLSENILRYKIGAKLCEGQWLFANNQSSTLEDATPFAWIPNRHQPPNWSKDAIVYHIFLDSFSPGDQKAWKQNDNIFTPFGGTLQGVIDKLEYISDLGCNTIWLSPVFDSPSVHGYDAVDLFKINPCLGSMEDFEKLVDSAHKLNIRIVLDFVANHWSNKHPTFIEAQSDPSSPYVDWYRWKKWPDDYDSYFGVQSMPELNLSNTQTRKHIIDAAKFWLGKKVDGFRLDHALGPEDDFWADFYMACKESNPDCWLFGEMPTDIDAQYSHAINMDGCLDFHLNHAIRQTFALRKWSLSRFAGFLSDHYAFHDLNHISMPTFLDNHDINRFLFMAGNNQDLLKLALFTLFMLPNPPIIYYGTEIGMTQSHPIHPTEQSFGTFEEVRLPFIWEITKDNNILNFVKLLINLRKKYIGSIQGASKIISVSENSLIIELNS